MKEVNNETRAKYAKRLLKLFAGGRHWTVGTLARDKGNKHVVPDDPAAERWCLIGACRKLELGESWLQQEIRSRTTDWTHIADFNDSHRWPTVFRLLKDIATMRYPTRKIT